MTKDIERRRAPSDEWGSEAAADWYGYKWGFGKLLAAVRKKRRLAHHGPGPGQRVETDGCAYKLSRNFIYHVCDCRDFQPAQLASRLQKECRHG